MNNPYREVTEAPKKFADLEKIEKVKSLLEERREPLFIHVHWMGTHGPNYYPDEQVFQQALISTIRKRIASSFTTTASSNLTRRSLIFINTLKKRIAWSTQF